MGKGADTYFISLNVNRFIHQGTVDKKKLGPGHLASPKAPDPNHCRLHDLCLEVLNVHGNELRQCIPHILTINVVYLT